VRDKILDMGVIRRITSLLGSSKSTVSFTDAEKAMELEARRKDVGAFLYEEDGFFYTFMTATRKFRWDAIEKIAAYKMDLLTGDQLCLEITTDENVTTFTEETSGWTVFLEKLRERFPRVPEDLGAVVEQPPFDTNLRVLWERG
jgi:hypothetical protein